MRALRVVNAPAMIQPESPDDPTVDEGSQELAAENESATPSPAVSPEVSPAVSPEVSADASPEVSPAVSPEVSAEVSEAAAPTEALPHGEPAAPVAPQHTPWGAEQWAGAGRAVLLFALLGMALVTWFRLTRERFTTELLEKNALDLPLRDVFLAQILGTGIALGGIVLVLCLFWRWAGEPTRIFEQWGWFLCPLLLLPAIPVVSEVDVWKGKHHDFLPIVLVLALLAELFFTRASSNIPPIVQRLWHDSAGEPARARVLALLSRHRYLIVVVCAALAYAAFMSFFTVRWHHRLGTATFDLGINVNLMHGGLHGKINQSTVIFPDNPQTYIANHVKLGLYLFLPIYALYPHPETLLVIQSTSLGLGSIPLFLLARRHVPEWAACVLALCYLANYPLHGANFYEMKEVPTGAIFVFLMVLFADMKRWWPAGIFFFCSIIMREDMPIPLAVIGIFLLLTGYRPRFGAIIAGISIFWFVLLRFKIMMDAGSWWFPNMYEDLWSGGEKGFRSVLKTLISNPTFVLKHVFVEKKFWYVMHLLVPLAFLPVRRWYLWASLLPGAILTLLVTDYDPPIMFTFQYVMFWLPYLFMAAMLAIRALGTGPAGNLPRQIGAVAAMAIATISLSYNYGAFPARDNYFESGYHKIRFSWGPEQEEQYRHVKALVASIPRNASVTTTEHIGAQLANREYFYTLRRGTHDADYMVARKSELKLNATLPSVKEALKSGAYGVVGRYGDFVVFKRGADPSQNAEIMKEWRLTSGGSKKKPKREREADEPLVNDADPNAPPEPQPDDAEDPAEVPIP